MESAFWNGFRLENFIFENLNITSPQGFVAVCLVTLAVAFVFEATRTLRDWLYLDFLKRRSCHGTTGRESPIVLQQVKPQRTENGSNGPLKSSRISSEKQESNGDGSTTETELTPARTPVIAAGTLSGSGKSCHKPTFQVGLLELIISTLFHVCQVFLGYILMLIVMTFNVWIFLAVLIGTGLGFFIFDNFNRKIHALKLNAANSNDPNNK